MRKLCAWSGALVLAMVLIIVGARQVGEQRKDMLAPILGMGSAASPQACWYGICPGLTSKQTRLKVLADVAKAHAANVIYEPIVYQGGYIIPYDACTTFMLPRWRVCVQPHYGSENRNNSVRIEVIRSNIHLGDVVAQLGIPSSMWFCSGVDADVAGDGLGGVSVTLVYKNGLFVSAYKVSRRNPPVYPVQRDEWRVAVDMNVTTIEYYPPAPYMDNVNNETSFAWRGFTEGPELQNNCGN